MPFVLAAIVVALVAVSLVIAAYLLLKRWF